MITQTRHLSTAHTEVQGHAIHFLKRLNHRASDSAAELAIRLYHHPQAVRYLLLRAPLPKGTTRVAIALRDSKRTPVAVVDAPSGRFITCLSEDMGHDLYCITHDQLHVYLEKHRQFQSDLMSLAPLIRDDQAVKRLFHRLRVAGGDLATEEIHPFTRFHGLLTGSLFDTILKESRLMHALSKRFLANRHLHPSRHRRVLKRYNDGQWLVGHLFLIVSFEGPQDLERTTTPELQKDLLRYVSLGSPSAMIGPMLRVVWAVGRLGKVILPSCRDAALHPISPEHWVLGILGLAVIAQRHPKCLAEVRKACKKMLETLPSLPGSVARFWHAAGAKGVIQSLVCAVEDPDTSRAALLENLRRLYLAGHKSLQDPNRCENAADLTEEVLCRHACRYEISLFQAPKMLHIMFQMLPWLSACEPEDIYTPHEEVSDTAVPWKPAFTLALIDAERKKWRFPKEPVTVPKAPGRNAPCPCGSQKKYKKCCLGKRPQPQGRDIRQSLRAVSAE